MTKFILTFVFLCVLSALFYYPVPMDEIEDYLDQEQTHLPENFPFLEKTPQNVVLELKEKKNKKKYYYAIK